MTALEEKTTLEMLERLRIASERAKPLIDDGVRRAGEFDSMSGYTEARDARNLIADAFNSIPELIAREKQRQQEAQEVNDQPKAAELSIRDRFAMAALQALIGINSPSEHEIRQGISPWDADAIEAYRYADACMKARQPKEDTNNGQ